MFERVRAAWGALLRPEAKASATSAVSWINQGGVSRHHPWTTSKLAEEGFGANIIAYLCVRLVMDAFASLPLLIFRRDAEVPDHPLGQLLNNPNPLQGQDRFLQDVAGYHLITGNAWIEAVRPRPTQPPRELYAHDPRGWEIILAPDGLPRAYRVHGDRGWRDFPLDAALRKGDVLHVGGFNPLPHNGGLGFAPTAAAARWIDLDNAGADLNITLAQGVNPSLALSFDANVSDEEAMRAREVVESKLREARRSGMPLITASKLTVERLSDSLNDMQWTEGMHEAARRICAAWNVPHILVVPGESTYANREQAHLELWEHTVLPFARLMLSDLVPWFRYLYRDDGLDVRIDEDGISALEPRRMTIRTSSLLAFEKGMLSLNEARLVWGYEPAEELADVADMPAALRNAQQADMMAQAQMEALRHPEEQQADRTAAPREEDEEEDEEELPIAANDRSAPRGFRKAEEKPAERPPPTVLPFPLPAPDRNRVPAGQPEGGQFAPGPTAETFARYLRTGKKAGKATAKAAGGDFADNVDDGIMVEETEPVIIDTMNHFGGAMLDSLGVGIGFDISDPRAVLFLRDYAGERIKGIGDTTRSALGDALAEAFERGARFEDIVKAIRAVMGDATRSRAENIATTETTHAIGGAGQIAMEDAGVERKRWITSRDHLVRPTHKSLDGQTRPVDEAFAAQNISGMYPGAMSGGASNNARCRCFVAAIPDEKADHATATVEQRDEAWKMFVGEMEEYELRMLNAVRLAFARQEQRLVVTAYRQFVAVG